MRFDFRIPPAVALVVWIGLAVLFAFVLVESGWQVSGSWEPLLWIGLTAFFAFFFYNISLVRTVFSKNGKNVFRQYNSAWWNQKATLWTCTIFSAFVFGSTISELFFRRVNTNPWINLALSYPYLLFFWAGVNAPMSSMVILLLLLVTISPSKKGDRLAKHFTVVFLIAALLLFTIQNTTIFYGLLGIKGRLN